MTILAKLQYGSSLYGTRIPTSDLDYRGVFLPTLRDCLLGTVKDTINDPTEEDTQLFSLPYFLRLASQGQSIAIEMLAAPDHMHVISSPAWDRLRAERKRFYTRNMHSFLGFAKSQAVKYSSRAERLSEIEAILYVIDAMHPDAFDLRLSQIWFALPESPNAKKTVNERNSNADKRAYVVCGREIQATATVEHAYKTIKAIGDEFGQRVRNAKDGLIDWKSLAHAFRVALQAREIVTTGDLKYPLADAEYLRDMRLGKVDFLSNKLDERLDTLINEVQALMDASSLPDRVDSAWTDQFVLDTYREHYTLPPL